MSAVLEAARAKAIDRRAAATLPPDGAQLWRSLLDNSSDAIVVLSASGLAVVEASRSFGEMLGYSPAELKHLEPRDWEVAGPPGTRLRRKDGSLLDVEINSSRLTSSGTEFIFLMVRDVTERKRAEQALLDETMLRQMAMESSRDGIVIVKMDDFSVVRANTAFAKLLGRAPDEVPGLHPWDWDVKFSKDDLLNLGAKANGLGIDRSVETDTRFRQRDGGLLDVELGLSYFEANGDRYACCVARDVTERRRAEQALKRAQAVLEQSDRRWNSALESAGHGVWDADVLNDTVYYSRVWKLMRGFEPDEIVDSSAESWLSRVHPDDRQPILDSMQEHHSGEIKHSAFIYRERHRAGHYIWISSLSAPIEWGPDGTPTRVIGTDTDICWQKVAEEEILRLARRLEMALDVSKIGVFEGNLETGELFWDDRLYDIFGLSRDKRALRAADWENALHPEDAPRVLAAVARAIEENGTFEATYRIITQTGDVRTVMSRGTCYRDSNTGAKFIGVNWDVTSEIALTQSLQTSKELAEARNVELEAARARIESQSLHDALTGLPNRRYLDEILNRHATGASALALLHIDLDRFKQINDTLGHVAGDAMLVHVARLLGASAGVEHFVARVGGDEFVVVCLNQTDTQYLATLADRIIAEIRRPVPYQGHPCRIGASIGIAIEASGQIDVERALINADVALYRAKGRGRNRYEFFSKALQDEIISTKRIADDILGGIERDEFLPHYQPLVDAKTFDLVGVEALVRWNHPAEGLLGPGLFLKIAEDLNVLASIDRLILEQAIRDRDHWATLGLVVPSVSVNVSFRRLNDEQLIPSLKELKIKPGTVSFEFLESIFLDEVEDLVGRNIEALRKMGIGVDVDDFGTGHTSIVSLLELSPRRFKIDRQLVSPIAQSQEQRRLVASIIDIGASLGIKVVAEGVETLEQAHILRDLGCDILQGYAFARPMPAQELINWIRAGAWRQAS